MCVATVGAGKMRMTLVFGTPVTDFEVPGSVLQESFVDKAGGNKTFEGAINRFPMAVTITVRDFHFNPFFRLLYIRFLTSLTEII